MANDTASTPHVNDSIPTSTYAGYARAILNDDASLAQYAVDYVPEAVFMSFYTACERGSASHGDTVTSLRWLIGLYVDLALIKSVIHDGYVIRGFDGVQDVPRFEKAPPDLATMPYTDYLQTEHWAEMRVAAIHRVGGRCQFCNSDKDLHVHHRTYERRGAELPEDLGVFCAECHKALHGVKDGKPTRMPVKVKSTPQKDEPTTWEDDPNKYTSYRPIVMGDDVFHPRFGNGTVVGSIGKGDDAEVAVKFTDHGVKRVMASLAGLILQRRNFEINQVVLNRTLGVGTIREITEFGYGVDFENSVKERRFFPSDSLSLEPVTDAAMLP